MTPRDLRGAREPRFKERGSLCRLTPIEGYTGPICSCFWRECDTCAACGGDPEAHDLHVCGQYPEQVPS